jgi:hypothetical protein
VTQKKPTSSDDIDDLVARIFSTETRRLEDTENGRKRSQARREEVTTLTRPLFAYANAHGIDGVGPGCPKLSSK